MSIFPIFSFESLPHQLEFIPAIVIGFAFGFVLERGGFGQAQILVSQFYLNNMRVFKVMFTGIITAASGFALLSGLGLLDLSVLSFSETFIWPMIVGGFLLGAGFVISGYCPGTSVVAAGAGQWDGLMTVIGVIAGSVVFAEVYPLIDTFYLSSPQGTLTLTDVFGIPFPYLAAGIAVIAVALFFGAEKVEAIFSRKRGEEPEKTWDRATFAGLGVVVAGAAAGIVFLLAGSPLKSIEPPKEFGTISAVELAQGLVEDSSALYVVDTRAKPDCEGADRIPSAVCLEDITADLSAMFPGKPMVVYGAPDPDQTSLAALQAFKGNVVVLTGGLASWKVDILTEPAKDAPLPPDQRSLRLALRAHFTGSAAAPAAAAPGGGGAPKVQRKVKKGGGCS